METITFNFKKCPYCPNIMSTNRNTCCLTCAKIHMEKKYGEKNKK